MTCGVDCTSNRKLSRPLLVDNEKMVPLLLIKFSAASAGGLRETMFRMREKN